MLTLRASAGTSYCWISTSSIRVCARRNNVPTSWPTRSKLEREYGSRASSRAVASASREVPCATRRAIARAVCGSHPSATTPARTLTGSSVSPLRSAFRYTVRITRTVPASV
jgi:hypothetical protein